MKNLYTSLISGAAFPLHEKLKGHTTVSVKKAMENSQWWSRAQLEEYRVRRLREFLSAVYAHVPYYQSLFDRLGFAASSVTSVADLQQLPFLDKKIIRENQQDLKADNATRLSQFNTGGSSGEPLVFFIGNSRVSHDVAAKWRATRWWDVDIGDREIVLWGSPIELGAQDRFRLLRDRMFRSTLLPAFEMSETHLNEFIAAIRAMRPRMLFGYPSVLAHIAQHAENNGLPLDDLGIKVAFVTSERLYQEQREKIERRFGCKVANGYGGRDAGFIAHECPEGGMHITAEDIIVEIVDPQGKVVPDGESGEVVITHLFTDDFPFIRYCTGDVASLSTETCACGRGLPMLKEIHGRTTDFIIAADGTVMHGLALIYVLREMEAIRSFKIIQETREWTRVEVVGDEHFSEQHATRIMSGFKKRLGENVTIDVERVEKIKPERSGKYRYVISKVVT
ncbi:MAG TPA: phenylacetate--CoA ligase family protein [Gammaproteobacteria bacterium]|nr:phenylacetate--CoA ligase family protein [Gammaproteobacteria bacterium]